MKYNHVHVHVNRLFLLPLLIAIYDISSSSSFKPLPFPSSNWSLISRASCDAFILVPKRSRIQPFSFSQQQQHQQQQQYESNIPPLWNQLGQTAITQTNQNPNLQSARWKLKSTAKSIPETTSTTTTSSSNTNSDKSTSNPKEEQLTYFETLAGNALNCLIQSDYKRKGGGDGGGSTGWTSWVDDASSYQLKCCLDNLVLSLPVSEN